MCQPIMPKLATPEVTTEQRKFETTTCGRCGGSGHYSYCQRYGTKCFGCGGSGLKHTKRGAMAWALFNESLKVRAGDLVPGDYILSSGCEIIGPAKWYKVIAHGYGLRGSRWFKKETNEWMPFYDIDCEGFGSGHFGPDAMVRKRWSNEEKAALRNAALDYQDTLTKTGTVRKKKS
jgi:hypothetical protein